MDDLISRQAAIDEIKEIYEWHDNVTKERIIEHFARLPSAQPEKRTEERTETHACDLIDRQAAIDALKNRWKKTRNYEGIGDDIAEECELYLKQVPSAQPERKTGRWIKTARWGRVYYCDQCRNYLDFDGVNAGRGSTNFCPNCGAKMLKEGE